MDPNSTHQTWSLWEYRVYPTTVRPTYETVKTNCARFAKLIFGSASSMRIRCATDAYGKLFWEVAVLTEGHPVQEAMYCLWVHAAWIKFFEQGFGASCQVQTHARLEAGDRDDGRPADQLIILPSLTDHHSVSGD